MGTMRLVVDELDDAPPREVPVETIGALVGNPASRLWLDLADPDEDDVAFLRDTFGFHPLALKEVTLPHERPRCDVFGRYYFIVVYAAEISDDGFRPRELNVFWGPNYLVTIHRRPPAILRLLEMAEERWQVHDEREAHGVSTLAYCLFESLVDGYFAVQDRVRVRIDETQDAIFRGEENAAADLFRLRKELMQVPRLLGPTSHVLGEVLRRQNALPERLRPYFAMAQDHASHVLAEMETYRDLLGAALDVQVFYAFSRLGHIMQRLTAITVIIMVPNFVASIYGMNFEHLAARQLGAGLPDRGRLPGDHGGVGLRPLQAAGMAVIEGTPRPEPEAERPASLLGGGPLCSSRSCADGPGWGWPGRSA